MQRAEWIHHFFLGPTTFDTWAMEPPPLKHYQLARDDRFRPWWVSNRPTVIYDFYTNVANVKEASQILRRQFSGNTSMAIRGLTPGDYNEEEKAWVSLEVAFTPEKSRLLALKRGVRLPADITAAEQHPVTVVPAIRSNAAGSYMIMRFQGLPVTTSDDDLPMTAAFKIRRSIRTLFRSWKQDQEDGVHPPPLVLDAFPELLGEDEDVYQGSVVVLIEGDHYIPQKDMERGTAYIAAYGTYFPFEALTYQYAAYCRDCRTIDSHTTDNCKFFNPY